MADSSVTIPATCSSHSGTVPLDLYNHIFAEIPLQSLFKISKRAFFCPRVTELLRCGPLIASNNLGKVTVSIFLPSVTCISSGSSLRSQRMCFGDYGLVWFWFTLRCPNVLYSSCQLSSKPTKQNKQNNLRNSWILSLSHFIMDYRNLGQQRHSANIF